MCDCEPVHPLTPREKVVLKPCPFCGGEAFAGSNFDNDHYVMCGADCDRCGGMVGYMKTEMAAIENWNRRTALASGSGDHAELAAKAERCTTGDPWYKDEDLRGRQSFGQFLSQDRAFIAAANPATVLALLAENAALNDYGRSVAKEALGYRNQATEAERKLAEAVGLLSELEQHVRAASEGRGHARAGVKSADAIHAFLSKEAERG